VVAALYLSIWIALALFAAGEAARRGPSTPAWAWWTSAAGLLLAAAHVVLAFEVRHEWSHDSAYRETARQTSAVYGLDWGGGLYVNFAFLTVWAIDLWRWRAAERQRRRPSRLGVWLARAFYFIVIVNGAVIFASGMRRALGVILVAWLVLAWRPQAGRCRT
jgi:hypothetical protein